jgi:hypothetical protein
MYCNGQVFYESDVSLDGVLLAEYFFGTIVNSLLTKLALYKES